MKSLTGSTHDIAYQQTTEISTADQRITIATPLPKSAKEAAEAYKSIVAEVAKEVGQVEILVTALKKENLTIVFDDKD